MSVIAILVALLLEQVRPLARANPIHSILRSWVRWTGHNFDAGRTQHGWLTWGIAVLASYAASGATESLAGYLHSHVFPGASFTLVEPHPDDVDGFAAYLIRYRAGLAIERTAGDSI